MSATQSVSSCQAAQVHWPVTVWHADICVSPWMGRFMFLVFSLLFSLLFCTQYWSWLMSPAGIVWPGVQRARIQTPVGCAAGVSPHVPAVLVPTAPAASAALLASTSWRRMTTVSSNAPVTTYKVGTHGMSVVDRPSAIPYLSSKTISLIKSNNWHL